MIPEILLILTAFLFVFSGILGIFLPFLPGVPVAWLGLLLFAYATYFAAITWKTLLIFLVLVFGTLILDALAPLAGARKYNASPYGLAGSAFGLILGLAVFGPIGIVLGPFLGALAGEIIFGKELESAFYSAKGTLIGFLASSAIKLALILAMLGYMVWSLF